MFELHRRQQLAGFVAGAVAARIGLRTMLVNSLRLTGDHAEQFAEILHKTTPDLRLVAETSRRLNSTQQPSEFTNRIFRIIGFDNA